MLYSSIRMVYTAIQYKRYCTSYNRVVMRNCRLHTPTCELKFHFDFVREWSQKFFENRVLRMEKEKRVCDMYVAGLRSGGGREGAEIFWISPPLNIISSFSTTYGVLVSAILRTNYRVCPSLSGAHFSSVQRLNDFAIILACTWITEWLVHQKTLCQLLLKHSVVFS
jgi:hypothetical protein